MTVLEVPFRFEKNQVVVETRVNGRGPYRMYVDTLTDPSVIEVALARDLGLTFLGEDLGEGQGDEDLVIHTLDPVSLDLAELHAPHVDFLYRQRHPQTLCPDGRLSGPAGYTGASQPLNFLRGWGLD